MTDIDKNEDFWDLGDFKKSKPIQTAKPRGFSKSYVSTVTVEDHRSVEQTPPTDSKLTNICDDNGQITKYIPPHSNAIFAKKHILLEYSPQNPLIKSVILFSDKENDSVFVKDNLFIRERAALLDRAAPEKPYVPFYSYSPRYSQLNKSQLGWYLWWRENTRCGIFIPTDESYVILYAYELAATTQEEGMQAALDMLCSLLTSYSNRELSVIVKLTIRDIICDFCLINKLPPPTEKLCKLEKQILLGSFLPEFFVDFSQSKQSCAVMVNSSMSLYDYRRSKCYNETTAPIFQKGIEGALRAVLDDSDAFDSITSYTRGVYGSISEEHHPFNRMVNIVNRHIKLEVTYYELSGIKTAVTDIVRYSENKVREHLGIKTRIHVLTINPAARAAADRYFEQNLPAQPAIDRRIKVKKTDAQEVHEYDRFYDVPKSEISPERALEIERESWDITKKLTEAFGYEDNIQSDISNTYEQSASNGSTHVEADMDLAPDNIIDIPTKITTDTSAAISDTESSGDCQSVFAQLRAALGDIADFVNLCRSSSVTEQKRFALLRSTSVDEIADKINEVAVELFGDIILEDDGSSYKIIEDYLFLFE